MYEGITAWTDEQMDDAKDLPGAWKDNDPQD